MIKLCKHQPQVYNMFPSPNSSSNPRYGPTDRFQGELENRLLGDLFWPSAPPAEG